MSGAKTPNGVTPASASSAETLSASVLRPAVHANGVTPKPKPFVGPLPASKTITVTWVPDFTNAVLLSPEHPVQLSVVMGPANTRPENAKWRFDFLVYSTSRDELGKRPDAKTGEVVVPKSSRALLWHDHGMWRTGMPCEGVITPHGTYEHAVLMSQSRVIDEELKCSSVVVRVYTEEPNPLALRYVPEKPNPNQDRSSRSALDGGYLKVTIGCQYYLNLTFASGSMIARRVAQESWRPIIYLTVVSGTGAPVARQFTNFVTNWAMGVEAPVDSSEQATARIARERARKLAQDSSLSRFVTVAAHGANRDAKSTLQDGLMCNSTPPVRALLMKPVPTLPPAVPAAPDLFEMIRVELERFPLHEWIVDRSHSMPQFPESIGTDIRVTCPPVTVAKQRELFGDETVSVLNRMDLHVRFATQIPERVKNIVDLPLLVSHLSGWLHLEEFVNDSELYKSQNAKQLPVASSSSSSSSSSSNQSAASASVEPPVARKETRFSALVKNGEKLVQRLYRRVVWFQKLKNESPIYRDLPMYENPLFIALCCKVIAADRAWQADVETFKKEAHAQTTLISNENKTGFDAFRAWIKLAGVNWPHSSEFRKQIEACGFAFRPMAIKRDQMECPGCKVSVSGWRAWHRPWKMHNLSLHDHEFAKKMELFESPMRALGRALVLAVPQRRQASSTSMVTHNILEAEVFQLRNFFESINYDARSVVDKNMKSDTASRRIIELFNSKPLVSHVVLYFTGPGSNAPAGLRFEEKDVIALKDIVVQWVFSDHAKAGAHLSVILDSCYSSLVVEKALHDFSGSGLRSIVSIQASAGPNDVSREGGFARLWIELAQQTKTPSAALTAMNAIGCRPSFFATTAQQVPPPRGFHLVGTRVTASDKKAQTQVAVSSKDTATCSALDDLSNV